LIACLLRRPKPIGDNGDGAAVHERNCEYVVDACNIASSLVVDHLHDSAEYRGPSQDRDLHAGNIQVQSKLL
jgi:hypothetical protein